MVLRYFVKRLICGLVFGWKILRILIGTRFNGLMVENVVPGQWNGIMVWWLGMYIFALALGEEFRGCFVSEKISHKLYCLA